MFKGKTTSPKVYLPVEERQGSQRIFGLSRAVGGGKGKDESIRVNRGQIKSIGVKGSPVDRNVVKESQYQPRGVKLS